MGTLVGHVAPGFGFLLLGLWHLFNHIKLHTINPNSYTSPPWFPPNSSINNNKSQNSASSSNGFFKKIFKMRYLELFLIMATCTASIAMELFIGPEKHQPFDPDWTIPTNHLHNFEHSSISMTFFVYSAFAIILDIIQLPNKAQRFGMTQFMASIAFAQQLLLFHLHSADHMGPEGQFHLLLQLLILVSLTTTLLGIGLPKSFMVSFIRSLSICSQGVWLIIMGFMLWTPSLISKGCYMNSEEGHHVVRCSDHEALHRAKSLVNLQFSWFLIWSAAFGVTFYLVLVKFYVEKTFMEIEYSSLSLAKEMEDYEEENDVESQKKVSNNKQQLLGAATKSFIQDMGKASFATVDIER